VASVSTLLDKFDDGVMAAFWANTYSDATNLPRIETGGVLRFEHKSGSAVYSAYQSGDYDLTGAAVSCELVNAGTGFTGKRTYLSFLDDTTHWIRIEVRWSGTIASLEARHRIGGAEVQLASIPYSPAGHRWLRMRHSGATVFWETSADGHIWAAFFSEATPITITAGQVELGAGNDSTPPFTDVTVYGAFNLGPLVGVLADNFNDNSIDAAKWTTFTSGTGTAVAETGSRLLLTGPSTGAGTAALVSGKYYDLTSSAIAVRIITLGPAAAARKQGIALKSFGSSTDQIGFYRDNTSLVAVKVVGGVTTTLTSIPYNSSLHSRLRIRESARRVIWESSADGLVWQHFSIDAVAALGSISAYQVEIFAGQDSGASGTTAEFDDVNIHPTRVPVARYQVEVAWTPTPSTGILILGTSTLGSNDVLTTGLPVDYGGVFEDLTHEVESIRITQGRSDALGPMQAGTCSLELRDPTGKYNPTNPSSPLYGLLEPFRAVRVSAYFGRATYFDSVMTDLPSAYWRMDDEDLILRDWIAGLHLSLTGNAGSDPGLLVLDGNPAHAFAGAEHAIDASSNLLQPDFQMPQFAVEFLIRKASAPAGLQTVFAYGAASFKIQVAGHGTLSLWLRDPTLGVVIVSFTGSINLCDNAPHHVVCKYDGAFVDVWVDGIRRSHTAETRPLAIPDRTEVQFRVASTFPAPGELLIGTIDELSVYDYPLPDARITAHYNASIGTMEEERHPLFFGFTRTAEAAPAPRRGISSIEANDLFLWLARASTTVPGTGLTFTGKAIRQILESVGWIDTARMSLLPGDEIPDLETKGDITALGAIEALLDAERGVFYIDQAGRATYRSRHAWASTLPKATVASEMTAIAPGFDLDRIRNRAKVTREIAAGNGQGEEQSYEEPTSVAKYGLADAGVLTTPYLMSDVQALGLAQHIVASQKDPRAPLWRLRIDNRTHDLLLLCLDLFLQDQVLVTEERTGTTGTFQIEQVQHEIRAREGRHTTDFLLSELPPPLFIVGTSLVGGTDVLGH
jgi:Concanavalin A-like lectin/glucanases superfamily